LDRVFGKPMRGTCPLTDSDDHPVCIQVPHTRDIFTTGGAVEIKHPDGFSRCYQIPADNDFSMILPRMPHEGENAKTIADETVQPEKPLLYAERSFTGYGQEAGGVQSILTNPSPDTAVEFVYMESLPWFMRIYLHTLQARVQGSLNADDDIIEEIYYRPALDRVRGTQLELRMRIPPASTVFLTYDFEKSILRYTEYPPDANRGFDVAASIITILPSASPDAPAARRKTSNLRTTSLLLSLPTPDFSMPYNVIIFTSTAIALAFGGLYNILVRRFVAADEGPEVAGGLKGKLIQLAAKITAKRKGAKGKIE
jgi:GPI-anchor transamidase subunit T